MRKTALTLALVALFGGACEKENVGNIASNYSLQTEAPTQNMTLFENVPLVGSVSITVPLDKYLPSWSNVVKV